MKSNADGLLEITRSQQLGGVDLATVMQLMGHASISTTMRYAHPIPENKRKAVNVSDTVFQYGVKSLTSDNFMLYP